MLDRGSQGRFPLMLKHDGERAGCLQQPATFCDNRATAARNSLQCDETEWFLPTGRHNDHPMAVKQLDKSLPDLHTDESHLIRKLKSVDRSSQFGQFRSISDDRQAGPQIALAKEPQSVNENIDPLVSN